MKKYYIYHIIGIKIGCSTQPKIRVKRQGYTHYEILEEHFNIDIASNREIELQKEYGYKIDNTSYKQSYDWVRSGNPSTKEWIDGAKKWIKENPEKHKENARLGGLSQGSIRGKINKESGHMRNLGLQQAYTQGKCPYCNKSGQLRVMKRWHFDNCKHKVVI